MFSRKGLENDNNFNRVKLNVMIKVQMFFASPPLLDKVVLSEFTKTISIRLKFKAISTHLFNSYCLIPMMLFIFSYNAVNESRFCS